MRILVLSNLYPPETIGGYELQCSQAVGELRRRGHEVLVLTTIPRRPVGEVPAHVLRRLGTPDVYARDRAGLRSPFWEFQSNLLNVENVYALVDVVADFQPDVCYLWNLVAIGGAGLAGAIEFLGIPWVWHLGDSVPAMLCNFDGQLPEMGRRWGEQMTGRFLACSQTVVDSVEELVPIRGRVRIVPNWVTNAAPGVERSYFDGTRLRMVHAGRLTEEKGSIMLLEVAATLRALGADAFHLDLIGTGEIDEIRNKISALGIGDFVDLVGWLPPDELRARLREYDLFLFPTYREDPMPLAPLEAAAAGCVPLIPEMSGVSEWLVQGVHCLKAERSVDAFAKVLLEVIGGTVDLSGIARRAARAMYDDFSIDKIMPTVEEELVLAAARGYAPVGKADELYRMALIADALLRASTLERGQHSP